MKNNYLHFIRFSVLLAFIFLSLMAHATHNRAGEIVYTQDPNVDFKVIATITTYTKASSTPADRDSLELCWGDGTCQWVLRSNGAGNPPQGEELDNDIKKNFYIAEHLYPGPGRYKMSMLDRNRNEGIINVNPPNSDQIEFFISTTVTFTGSQFLPINNSPVLLQPPIDIGCVGQRFIHNPNAFDIDGDSLVYERIVPQRDLNTDVPIYRFPNEISPGADNLFSVNRITGDIVWESPQLEGEYNIAIYIIEYRNGAPLDTMIRDMQILILECDNMPPEIETVEELCVVAGEIIDFGVIATDPDMPLQLVALTALGGPFELDINPAIFTVDDGFQPQPLNGRFLWETTCEHISSQFYNVVFKAVDNDFFPQTTSGLATLKTVRIKVVGPPPQDVTAEAESDIVRVTWASPYVCEDADDDYFRTFTVWRREGSNLFPLDNCMPGLQGRGYQKITFSTRDVVDGRYTFIDADVERGRTYCYRVLAEFARTTSAGFPFALVESLPSNETCLQLSRDIPLITNVDVDQTSTTDGEIIIRWSKPITPDLDTLLNPGPYTYEVWRSTGFDDPNLVPIPGSLVSSNTFADANDTTFVDTGINTLDNPYTYAVAFTTGASTEVLGTANTASSTFLSIFPSDQSNTLSWEHFVGWNNFNYNIFRKAPMDVNFTLIGNTAEMTYTDEANLRNGVEYCYYVECEGTYGVDGIASPLFNRSQEACGIPEDIIPPCPPELNITNICDDIDNIAEDDFINTLNWTNPNIVCPDTDDVISYQIFYAPTLDADLDLIAEITGAQFTTYEDMPSEGIAGCYAVSAIDSVGNESVLSNIVCVDNCPLYELPNAFTPNGDNANDFFIPFPYRFIDRIDIKIYNQWGNLVHETQDPDINWDGTNTNDEALSDGVYYYVCQVFEKRVAGIVESPDILKGFIELRTGR
jgi:gliding motility-associated-like protein